jgi:hypothetical protein
MLVSFSSDPASVVFVSAFSSVVHGTFCCFKKF